MTKANAYGLEAQAIAEALKDAGAKIIAVADLQELWNYEVDIDMLILGEIFLRKYL